MTLYAISTDDDSPALREAIDARFPSRIVDSSVAGMVTTLDIRPDLSPAETYYLDGLMAAGRLRLDGAPLAEFRARRAVIVAFAQAASPTNAQRDAAIRAIARIVQKLVGDS